MTGRHPTGGPGIVKAAIVGVGWWGQSLVNAVQKDGNPVDQRIRFTHAVVREGSASGDFADRQRLVRVPTLEEALALSEVEAIVLATPHELHIPQVRAALLAGKHVFVEKPLASDGARAREALELARERQLVLSVGYNRRFLPGAQMLRDFARRAPTDGLIHVDAHFATDSGLRYAPGSWRAEEAGPLSAMTAMGAHVVDFLIFLCGPIEQVRTTSARRTIAVAADDLVRVDLHFGSGATASITLVLTSGRQWRIQVFRVGEWATLLDERSLETCRGSGAVETTLFEAFDTLRAELESFAGAVRGETLLVFTEEELVHGAEVFEAIMVSHREGGRRVEIDQHASRAGQAR